MNKSVILCVDDEKVVLTSLKAQLKNKLSTDFIIETAENGKEALDIFIEYHEKNVDIPVVIADHIMPGMKGDELLIKIHEISKSTYNIMLTGQANAEAVGNAVNNARLYRYIAKPWDSNDLNLTVSEAIKSFDKDKKIKEQQAELEDLVKKLKIYNEQLEIKVKERTAEISLQKKEIELKNEVLQQQKEEIETINEELCQHNEEISAQRDQLSAINKAVSESIHYAKRIQTAVLPQQAYIDEILPEHFILYMPRDIVSGDFYWVRQINHYIVIAVADCTGHGVPGAIMSMLGISLLNEIVQRREITQANQVLNELRKQLKHSLKQTGREGGIDDGMDIALCAWDTKTNIMQYAGANTSLFLIRNKELTEIKADRMPIGFYPKEKPTFTNHEIQMNQGDLLYMFTDGFIDQFGGENGMKFKTSNLQKILLENHDKPMKIQKERLDYNINTWMKGYDQTDDILVIGVRI